MGEKSSDAISIAREYFPDLPMTDLGHVIWGLTGFPGFFRIPEDGDTKEACFRNQLKKAKAFYDAFHRLPDDPYEKEYQEFEQM